MQLIISSYSYQISGICFNNCGRFWTRILGDSKTSWGDNTESVSTWVNLAMTLFVLFVETTGASPKTIRVSLPFGQVSAGVLHSRSRAHAPFWNCEREYLPIFMKRWCIVVTVDRPERMSFRLFWNDEVLEIQTCPYSALLTTMNICQRIHYFPGWLNVSPFHSVTLCFVHNFILASKSRTIRE